jgi:hypothetical protein
MPSINVLKLFLEHSSLATLSSPPLYFKLQASRSNAIAYFRLFFSDKEKKLDETDAYHQCFKTFFLEHSSLACLSSAPLLFKLQANRGQTL